MKTRKLIALMLALVILVSGMTACGSDSEKDVSAAASTAVAQAIEAAAHATEAAVAVRAMTQVAQTTGAMSTGTSAAGPSPLVTPTPCPIPAPATHAPVSTAPPPPMPSPEICAEESEPFWHWQAGGVSICDFFFTTSAEGFAIGEPNTMLRTNDGGSSWRAWPFDSPYWMRAIHFSSPEAGWVAGDGGTIMRTTDGGITWQAQDSGTEEDLKVIKFWDDKIGWAGGWKTLLRTTDGGVSWSTSTVAPEIMRIVDLAFVDPQEGYLVGYEDFDGLFGRVLHTTDGGASWEYTGFSGPGPVAIYAAKDMPIWVAGGWVKAALWKGADHTSRDITPGGNGTFREVFFSDAQHGWAVGDGGLAVFTEDGGEHWQSMGVDEYANWTMLRFTSEEDAVLAGTSLDVAHSSDGGKTWATAPVSGPSTDPYLQVIDLDFVDPWFGWAVVAASGPPNDPYPSGLLITTDGGQSWERHEPLGGGVYQLEFADRLRGWAIGEGGLVARSDDGGQSWGLQSIPFPEGFHAISSVDREHAWIVSATTPDGACRNRSGRDSLTLFRTASGGDEWEGPICIELPVEIKLSWGSGYLPGFLPAMQFVDQETGWLVGADGLIVKTTDGGLNWQVQASGVSAELTDVYFLDSQTGWVTGDEGILLQTTDGGEQWIRQRVGKRKLTGVRFVNKDTGWVTSRQGPSEVLYTLDGGQTWNPVGIDDPFRYLYVLDAVDERHVWVGMSDGIRAYAPVCVSASKP